MSPRKSVEKELTRDMIMDVARKLFVKEGYQHVSMRQIAKELTYSHGAIYYHFKNKAELFYAIVAKDFTLLDQEIDKVMKLEMTQEEKIKEVLIRFIRFGLTHQQHYELMFLTKDEEIRELLCDAPNKSYEKFAQTVYELSEEKINLQEIWSIFLSLHGFVTHYCRTNQQFEDVKELAMLHVNRLL
ncbi:TetR/AcrR family transcriptional regulator [Metabacillus iocasae]|uniref:AcrR family transcriptional regulator n=1 Tax=Priestia iocasae TaxID=2291674 RepID=A0ABS2QUQ3_9BACI|nr:TetR/AcrR family transcriptional regulator [Metabacillus iocasae]MBM7703130.1 AcrR family transcriptional regulator [Metabacillus iocasae]